MTVRARRTAVGMALFFGVLAGTALPATAGASPSQWPCNSSSFCIYHDQNGKGAHYSLKKGIYDLSGVGGGLNDHVWSVRNQTGDSWCLYRDAGYKNRIQLVTDGQAINLSASVRKQVSSVRAC